MNIEEGRRWDFVAEGVMKDGNEVVFGARGGRRLMKKHIIG